MANLSDTTGFYYFTFSKNVLEHKESINHFFQSLYEDWEGGCYNTIFTDLYQGKLATDCKGSDERSICLSFSGCGRWDYYTNIDWYFGESNTELNIIDRLHLLGSEIRLESIDVEFQDIETGNMVYIESCISAEIDYDSNEPRISYAINEQENRDLTRDDMLALGYDESDLEDMF